MAPEQARGSNDQVGAHTDVYALGNILYEMIKSRPPINGSDQLDVLKAVIHQMPDPIDPFISGDLAAVCEVDPNT
jgi:serine/threonine protein kinase